MFAFRAHSASTKKNLNSSTRAVLALAFMLPACACTSMTAVSGMAPIVGAPSVQNPSVTVRVMPGDTLSVISQRHGVPMSAILAANALRDSNSIRVGQTLRIPASVVSPNAVATLTPETPSQPSVAEMAARPIPSIPAMNAPPPAAPRPVVAVAKPQKPAKPDIDKDAERELLVSARMTSLAKPSLKPRDFAMNAKPPMTGMGGPLITQKPQQMAAVEPSKPISGAPAPGGQPDDFTATNKFIWPVTGRVISSFGERTGGYANDGINIEVAEGTPVKASDHGVVIYAGNELAGFGNLLLVKHSNGFVTAYAHNSKLLVKKGAKVRQGEVIAQAGKSGDVDKPQVHFEIRRGDRPVDPKRYIDSASVSL
jgi:murein DD-endopeptidase MepM/ murein hydrolase activator NlpD